MTVVAAGRPAPDFTLATFAGKPFTRAQLEGRTTILVFYPFAFSPVCTDQLNVYNELLGDFAERGATLYGVSCDAIWSQRAFKEELGIAIEQLSDFEPKGATCRAFGVLHPGGYPAAGARRDRPRRGRALELRGAFAGRPAGRQPPLRRPRRPRAVKPPAAAAHADVTLAAQRLHRARGER